MAIRGPCDGCPSKSKSSSVASRKEGVDDLVEDSVASIDCSLPRGLEDTLLRLTEAVRELKDAEETESSSVDDLLTRAQSEINKLSSRRKASAISPPTPMLLDSDDESLANQELDETRYISKAIDEDKAFLQSIPLQSLLGACYQQQQAKRNLGQRVSASMESTFQSTSPKDSLPSSSSCFSSKCSRDPQRSLAILGNALANEERERSDSLRLVDSRSSIASVCPSLPCSGDDEVPEVNQVKAQRAQESDTRMAGPSKQLMSPPCVSRAMPSEERSMSYKSGSQSSTANAHARLDANKTYLVDGKVSLPSFECMRSKTGVSKFDHAGCTSREDKLSHLDVTWAGKDRSAILSKARNGYSDKLSSSWPDHRHNDLDAKIRRSDQLEILAESPAKQEVPKVSGLLATACVQRKSPLLGTSALQPYRCVEEDEVVA